MTYPDAVNLDRVKLPGVDVVWNVDDHEWPFPAGRFAQVWGCNIFEHVRDPIAFMADAWRVLEPGGLLHLVGPWWQSEDAHTDPTHRRSLTLRTFDYWIPGTALHDQLGAQYAGDAVFECQNIERIGDSVLAYLVKL